MTHKTDCEGGFGTSCDVHPVVVCIQGELAASDANQCEEDDLGGEPPPLQPSQVNMMAKNSHTPEGREVA